MAQSLAFELYQAIIQHIEGTVDLLSVALCCAAFRDEAQRCLFRHVEPTWDCQYKRFISAINASPLRLGPLIYSFNIVEGMGADYDDDVASLSIALRAMPNLAYLRNMRWWMPMIVLNGCTFKLRTLVWDHYLRTADLLFLLYNFLPTQDYIKCLQLGQSEPMDAVEVPTNLCPQLDLLCVREEIFSTALLRGDRLITRFHWNVLGPLPAITTQQLNHLEYLLCYTSYEDSSSPAGFTSFPPHLTSLVLLELLLFPEDLLHNLEFLRSIPTLEVLVIQLLGVNPDTYDEQDAILHLEYTSAYQYAFEVCPALKYLRPRNGDSGILISDTLIPEQEAVEWRRLGAFPAFRYV